MTATTIARNATKSYGALPYKLTMSIAGSINLLKGTIVTADANGRADVPTAGQDAMGIACADYVNATGSNDAFDVEVDTGVFSLGVTGTAPKGIGEVLFVVDNQTVSLDSSGGTRGVAGYCVGVDDDGQARVLMGPQFSAAYADVSATDTIANAASAKVDNLAVVEMPVPLGSFRKADGSAVAAFANGSADGFNLTDSEAFGIRWNDDIFTAFWADIRVPSDLDETAAVELHFLVSKIGSTDTTAVLTVSCFRNRPGGLHDAGSDLGGNTSAINSATKTVVDKSVTLTASGVAAGDNLSFSVVPSAALDDDDLLLLACYLKYTRTGA